MVRKECREVAAAWRVSKVCWQRGLVVVGDGEGRGAYVVDFEGVGYHLAPAAESVVFL